MSSSTTIVAAIVGIDGCGKSSTFQGALESLAQHLDIVGIGDEVIAGAPGIPVHERDDLPLYGLTSMIGRTAKRSRRTWLYRQLKTLDLIARSRMRDHIVGEESPAALLSDGDPLVNTLSWSVGRLYRDELQGDDDRTVEALHYLAGERSIPRSRLGYYLRHAPQLAIVNRLRIARFRFPDLVILLELDPSEAMVRIRRRGRPLQSHETEAALGALAAGYDRVCGLLESRCGIPVLRIPVAQNSRSAMADRVADAILELAATPSRPRLGDPADEAIEVVATTISGSLKDQRKIGRIGPHFAALTERPSHVHVVDSHQEARDVAQSIVSRGGRLIVSAGGAGTFNAVLEGCHRDGTIPDDIRLAFLRKGSADLIGKALRIPDDLSAGVEAIVDGIERDRRVSADVLTIASRGATGQPLALHLVGFGGLGIFGAVPRFTEARWVKHYKGLLGSTFGDYGPFYAGLALATLWWYWRRLRGQVPALILELDGETFGPAIWNTVVVVNGDMGKSFPLGRGLSFSSGTYRVVAMQDPGLLGALRQLAAARTGAILEDPSSYGCIVHEVRSFKAFQPAGKSRQAPKALAVNVDGLRMDARDDVRLSISGHVELIAGPERPRCAG